MKKLASLLLLLGLCSGTAHAETVKALYSDAGLYNGDGPMDLFHPNDSSILTLNLGFQGDPTPPEGSRVAQVEVKQNNAGWFGIFNVGTTRRDWSDYSAGTIKFWHKTTRSFTVQVEYGVGGAAQKSGIAIAASGGIWKEETLRFNQFAPAVTPTHMQQMISGFIFVSDNVPSDTEYFFDNIRWEKPITGLRIFPESTTVNPGSRRQFTVMGVGAGGTLAPVSANFSVVGSVGTLNTTGPTGSVILTAGSTSGNVRATLDSLSVQAAVTITNSDLSEQLGILSETVQPTLRPDPADPGQDSAVALFPDPNDPNRPNDPPALSNDASTAPEGSFSNKLVFPRMPNDGFGGMAVQWGDFSTDDAHVRDMSAYYDGAIQFWFKARAALSGRVQFGIRSGNVSAGSAPSKSLNDYGVLFNNQWQPVVIPVADLVGNAPAADLSRMKVLAVFSIVGRLSGSESRRTIHIDNLRWNTHLPGALDRIVIEPSGNPDPVPVPAGFPRTFIARGFDANDNEVDISPLWNASPGGIGTVSPTSGKSTTFTPVATSGNGAIRARVPGITSTRVDFTITQVNFAQTFGIFNDMQVAGEVGVSTGPAAATNTEMGLKPGSQNAPEGSSYMVSTFTLQNAGANDAFAVWFVARQIPRFMRSFENGFLRFHVRTPVDLEISIRSQNSNASKVLLSELGIARDGTWQDVIIPLALFRSKEATLDFSEITTFFAIGATSALVGEVSNVEFAVDDVRWLGTDDAVADHNKIFAGIKAKQQANGLLRSFDSNRAVTYDQALGAMALTYRQDFASAKKIFEAYEGLYNAGQGFHDEYSSETNPPAVLNGDRTVGPNAWLLLALIHYRNASNDTEYDAIIHGLANWIVSFQDGDGAIRFGAPIGSISPQTKSTEHNLDAYAAFKAYALMSGNNQFNTEAAEVLNWLETEAWRSGDQRFNVGERPNGTANTDKALDTYSWAPLALGEDTSLDLSGLLALAETDFGVTQKNETTDLNVTGFDFGAPVGAAPDKDAVWLEGTAQMAVAHWSRGNQNDRANFYVEQLKKAFFTTGPGLQGITYATNPGTPYGSNNPMNSQDASLSSMAWFLFAFENFNPFQPYPIFDVQIQNVNDNQAAAQISWSGIEPPVDRNAPWSVADQYIKLNIQSITNQAWGLQIYTDNLDPNITPRFEDPTGNDSSNADSNPSGLLSDRPGQPTTHMTLPLAWSVKDQVSQVPQAADPNHTGVGGQPQDNNAFQWFFMKDVNTPNIDSNGNGQFGDAGEATAFVNGEDFVVVRKQAGGNIYSLAAENRGSSHLTQGDPAGATDLARGFQPTLMPDYIFLQANFIAAAAQAAYTTRTITFEFFTE